MRASSMMRWFAVVILGSLTSAMAACGSSGTGGTTGSQGCTPGAQQACACPGGSQGAQKCTDDGRSFGPCDCGSGTTTGSGSGTGGMGGGLISTGTGQGSCGDGIIQPGECNPGEFYCAADCMAGTGGTTTTTTTTTAGAGGACAGVVIYADKVDAVGSVWGAGHGSPVKTPPLGGKVGVEAGDSMCNEKANGSHACTYAELLMAKDEVAFKAIPAGTKAWVHRTAAVSIGGTNYPEGKGARCDDWLYATDHLNDGEWADFTAQGMPTYHLDSDPGTIEAAPKDAPCGANKLDRSILCCYPCP